jgi:hypothetical protein
MGKIFDDIPVPESAGVISFNRTSGSAVLFGSPFNHQHYITMRVHRAQVQRDLHETSIFKASGLPYIQVEMSASQFSEAITSLNLGTGIPCTVAYANGKRLERPTIENERELFDSEIDAATQNAVNVIEELIGAILEEKLPKKAQERLLGLARVSLKSLNDSLPFIAEMYAETLNGLEQKAKTEITAYADHVVHRFGLEAMANGLPMLPEGKE